MAKRRRVASEPQRDARPDSTVDKASPLFSGVRGLNPLSIAVGLLGAAVVYVAYYPSDSVTVERGDALWFCVLAICVATMTWSASCFASPGNSDAASESANVASGGGRSSPRWTTRSRRSV